MRKKIAILHRYPAHQIKETNAAFPYLPHLLDKGVDILTFKKFDRLNGWKKHLKSLLWIFYAPMLVFSKDYNVIYCDDSYPFYPAMIKLLSPRSKVVLRIGDFHLMYYFSGITYKVLHFFERLSWIMADEIIAISEAMAGKISEEINREVKVVLDPVDPDDFPPAGPGERNTVMFHGVLTKNKNVDLLLEAAQELPDVDFIIVGDGPDRNRLQKMAPKNVFFQGWVPFRDMSRIIASCMIGVALRSDNPGNEYVVTSPFLQYGIMGKPCLVTRRKVFGSYDYQFSGKWELVALIKRLTAMPIEAFNDEAARIRLYVLQNHDAKKISREIWEILMQA